MLHPSEVRAHGETTLEARDLDGDVSTIEAYFDIALNITWLADANNALTTGYDADGLMILGRGYHLGGKSGPLR